MLFVYGISEGDMKIETTIIIKHYHLKLLAKASYLTGKPKCSIVSLLMLLLARERNLSPVMWERVQYQKRDNSEESHCLHVSLKPGEYEMFLDMRKIFKKSVSLLLAHAIDEYLDDIINSINSIPDNYQVMNYAMNRLIIDNVINWVFSWGVTTRLLSHPLYSTT